jgi:hypothetical protein
MAASGSTLPCSCAVRSDLGLKLLAAIAFC